MAKISLIAAISKNRVIGANGDIPWKLSSDMKYFKAITTGHAVIMGRKTYESLGRPLPNRTNIVVTRQNNFDAPGCIVAGSFEHAIGKSCADEREEVFVIGGGELYREAIPFAHRLYITEVGIVAEGDTYFPEIDPAEWREVRRNEGFVSERDPFPHDFVMLERQVAPMQQL